MYAVCIITHTLTVYETLTEQDLAVVVNELHEAQNQSYELGLKLKLPLVEVERIHSTFSRSYECLVEVIYLFLECQEELKPTWKVIVDALRSSAINLPRLAEKVEAVHISDPSQHYETTGNLLILMHVLSESCCVPTYITKLAEYVGRG